MATKKKRESRAVKKNGKNQMNKIFFSSLTIAFAFFS